VIKDKEFGKKIHNVKLRKIEDQISARTNKSNKQVIDEFKQNSR